MSSLGNLQKLEVRNCANIEEIISHEEEIETSANHILFCALQHILLQKLPNLKVFFQGHDSLDFPSLQKVNIEYCPNMEAFSRDDAYTPKLEDLTIKIESLSSNYIQRKDINAVIRGFKAFVALQGSVILNWSKLYNEGQLIKNSKIDIVAFHKLLVLIPCDEIQMLKNVTELTMLGFQNLKSIIIEKCDDLRCVFWDVSMATSLPNLYSLTVQECKKMEEIIGNNNNNSNNVYCGIEQQQKDDIIFPHLRRIKLHKLPNLKCFGHSSFPSYVELPNCTKITIYDCQEMKSFWLNGTLYTPKLHNFYVNCTKFDEDAHVNCTEFDIDVNEHDEPVVEDDDEEEDEDYDEDDDEEDDNAERLEVDSSGRSKQTRSEKKSRKAMLKLGMKSVTRVIRVTAKSCSSSQNPYECGLVDHM
ncbi:disease resistance protein, partial [Trifolium medium]|nr:disease resistance protein [Trifolium medium]